MSEEHVGLLVAIVFFGVACAWSLKNARRLQADALTHVRAGKVLFGSAMRRYVESPFYLPTIRAVAALSGLLAVTCLALLIADLIR